MELIKITLLGLAILGTGILVTALATAWNQMINGIYNDSNGHNDTFADAEISSEITTPDNADTN